MSDPPGHAVILIVDDDPGVVRLLEKSLHRAGYRTPSANSGRAALGWLERDRPDLILLDLNLPDLKGAALVDRVQASPHRAPFIIITGQGDERVAVEMMKRGAIDYLVKDPDLFDFVPSVVERALRQLERDRKLAAAEEALRKEHAFTSAVLDTSGALVVVLDCDGRIIRFNRASELTTGYRFAEVRGQRIWDLFIPPEHLEQEKRWFDRIFGGEFPIAHENHWLTKGGERRWIAWSNTALLDGSHAVEYIIGTGLDMTEKKRLQKELVEISDRERRRLGQDLHDGLGQHLAGTELMSQVLEQQLAKKSKPEAAQAARIAEHVREAIAQTRLLARGLSPVSLEAEGLMAALQELAATTERLFRVHCQFQCSGSILIKDNIAATHLYRIAQEAINNAIKHGKARDLLLQLSAEGDHRRLSLRDSGAGFSLPDLKSSGMGLRIMHYRAATIGGTLTVESKPGSGTTVTCLFPSSL